MTLTRPVNGDLLDPALADEYADAIEALQALTTALTPLHAFKSVDGTPFSNTTAMANDETLFLTLPISHTYEFRSLVVYGAGTTADIKLGFTFPTGAVVNYRAFGTDVTAGGNAPVETLSLAEASDTAKPYGGAGVGSFRFVEYLGRISMSTTVGNFTLRRAQNTATVENTLIKAGSWLTAVQVA